jgi:hypothetical protein
LKNCEGVKAVKALPYNFHFSKITFSHKDFTGKAFTVFTEKEDRHGNILILIVNRRFVRDAGSLHGLGVRRSDRQPGGST